MMVECVLDYFTSGSLFIIVFNIRSKELGILANLSQVRLVRNIGISYKVFFSFFFFFVKFYL